MSATIDKTIPYLEYLKDALSALPDYVDTSKKSFWVSLLAIAFNPTAWNIVARNGGSFCLAFSAISDLAYGA